MKRKLLIPLAMLLLIFSFYSFKIPSHKIKKNSKDCFPTVTVHAFGPGIDIVRVTINGVNHFTNLTAGQSQDFTDVSFTQGSTITVEVACAGGGSHTRIRSIGCDNSGHCTSYPNYVTVANIVETKPCAVLLIDVATFPDCPI